MGKRLLTQQQIEEARQLRDKLGIGKRRLAELFNVSSTTIWENVYLTSRIELVQRQKQKRLELIRIRRSCVPCSVCNICMRSDIIDNRIPLSYRVDDKCIVCYLREHGLEYMDLYKNYE